MDFFLIYYFCHMKRIVLLIGIFLLSLAAFAQTDWTVQTVPNTRLQSNLIHVSDPDGYLSDSAEHFINMALDSIRSQADVFVVTLTSIGDAEPKHFATRLFNYWGIGDAATDNGILLLFVEDQHALEFETGYGAENTLTDARCSMIFNNTIKPYFIAGDYEGGLCAGVVDIVEVYGGAVPMGLKSFASTPPEMDDEDLDLTWRDLVGLVFILFFGFMAFFVPLISFFRWLAAMLKSKKKEDNEESLDVFEEDGVKYIKGVSTGWKASVWEGKAFLRFLLYGIGAFAVFVYALEFVSAAKPDMSENRQYFWIVVSGWLVYFSVTCLIQNTMLLSKAKKAAKVSKSPRAIYTAARKDGHSQLTRIMAPWFGIPFGLLLKKRVEDSVQCICPTCGADMMKDESFQLPEKRMAEENAGGYHFTPCRCPSGHLYVLREDGSRHSSVELCEACGAFASKKISEKTTVSPTYSSSGRKELTYECLYCHKKRVVTKSIPRLTRTSSSSGSRHYHSSHSGGSFGGGHSGGGGYSGRW